MDPVFNLLVFPKRGCHLSLGCRAAVRRDREAPRYFGNEPLGKEEEREDFAHTAFCQAALSLSDWSCSCTTALTCAPTASLLCPAPVLEPRLCLWPCRCLETSPGASCPGSCFLLGGGAAGTAQHGGKELAAVPKDGSLARTASCLETSVPKLQ